MTDRNVLYISYYFPPMGLSGVQRTVKFVKYLPEHRWTPYVLTCTPDSFYAFDDDLLNNFEGRNVKIFRTAPKKSNERKTRKLPSYFIQKLGRYVLNFLYQPDSKIKWKKQAVELGNRIIKENKIDLIVATAPPFTDFLIAQELSQKHDIPFIMDYRDRWNDNPFHYYPTPIHRNYSRKLEKMVLKYAVHIIVITRQAKENLLRRYNFLTHQDISIIPHGYDPDDFKPFSDVVPDSSKFTITHSGVFQDNRTPKYFLKAIESFIKKNPDAANKIELRFIGVMRKSHLKLCAKFGLKDNVVTTGYVSHGESIRNLMESDVLWMMLNDDVRTPGKLYEYFGARKPILICSPDGQMRKLALDCKAALAVDPDNVKEIENTISTLYQLWRNRTLPKPDKDFVSQFDRTKLTAELSRQMGLSIEIN
jgi:glycosyltransferase involved in cell wall biosynthesis